MWPDMLSIAKRHRYMTTEMRAKVPFDGPISLTAVFEFRAGLLRTAAL